MRDFSSKWQHLLVQGFSSAATLLDFLNLSTTLANVDAEKPFATRVPLGFAQRMEKGNANDPLLKQVLAVEQELVKHEGFEPDPLQERLFNPVKGLIHKYHGRVLMTLTGACAVNCRYCFRRSFPYKENNPGRLGWQACFDYIAQEKSIKEVILSGGDPLLVQDDRLAFILEGLSDIPHVQTVRIHTRMPVVLPERVDEGLYGVLRACTLRKVVVLHCNHPHELNESVRVACNTLQNAGCYLMNQSVLLAGVNDSPLILAALSERLFEFRVLPYYLHLLDKVEGSAHFEIPLIEARSIFEQLQALLPGYLVPRLAVEEACRQSKTIV